MSKKIGVVAGIGGVLVLAYFCVFGVRITRLSTIQNVVAKNVKIGDSPEVVSHFLDTQGLEHSELIRPEVMGYGAGHHYENLPVIVVVKRHTKESLLLSERIYVVFVFDEQHKLARFDVFPMWSGGF
jgi:hypothetical protein